MTAADPVNAPDPAPADDWHDQSRYVSLTMEFRCNLRCVHCMIEGTMDRLVPQSDDRFDEVMDHNRRTGQWSGLILTGSEITLRRDLPDLARRARASGFRDIRIQTHGMRLGNPDFARELVEAGVNEFFISVAGDGAESHDRITRVRGAWGRMIHGIENLETWDHVKVLTNTVVTEESYRLLPGVVAALAGFRNLRQMEFWIYWPMQETDDKNLIASYPAMLPWLRKAAAHARAAGRRVEIKNVPQCLLGDDADLLVNDQPLLLIDPAFWTEFHRNGFHQCPRRAACASRQCLGFNTAYIGKFGTHDALLRPYAPGMAPGAPADQGPGPGPGGTPITD